MFRTSVVLSVILWAQIAVAQLAPTITKSFNPTVIPVNGTTAMTLTIGNPNPATALTNLRVTDTLPPALFGFVSFGGGQTCDIGSFASLSGVLTVTHQTLAGGATCSLTIIIRGLAMGTFRDTTGNVTSDQATGGVASAILFVGPVTMDAPFQVSYAANLAQGESYINVTNDGANGAPLLGPGFGGAVGNICVNVYAFSPDEQLISCCSCLVTPNGLVNLGVTRDLTSKTLTGVIPTSVVVKLVATLAGAGGSGTTCTNSAATATRENIVPGMLAWSTNFHTPGPFPGFRVNETPFGPAILSAGELASLTGRCAAIIGNGSGFGICRSCQAGALGGAKGF